MSHYRVCELNAHRAIKKAPFVFGNGWIKSKQDLLVDFAIMYVGENSSRRYFDFFFGNSWIWKKLNGSLSGI